MVLRLCVVCLALSCSPTTLSAEDDLAGDRPVVSELKKVYSEYGFEDNGPILLLPAYFYEANSERAALQNPQTVQLQVSTPDGQPVSNAAVLVTTQRFNTYEAKTNPDGTALLSIPGEWKLTAIGVVKPGMSCDYRVFVPDSSQKDPTTGMALPEDFSGKISFTMTPVASKTLQVFDPKGAPVAGVKLKVTDFSTESIDGRWTPWGHSMFHSTTDANGKAVFDLLNSAEDSTFDIKLDCQREDWRALSDESVIEDLIVIESDSEKDVSVHYEQLVALEGTTEDASGRPIPNVRVCAFTLGVPKNRIFGGRSDANGQWRLLVSAEQKYHVRVTGNNWESRAAQNVTVGRTPHRCEAPVIASPNFKVNGMVTGTFQTGDKIRFRHFQPDEDDAGVITPASYVADQAKPSSRSTRIESDGTFQCYLPAGHYRIDHTGAPAQTIVVGNEKEQDVLLKLNIPPSRDIHFRVIDDETGLPVRNAFVYGQTADVAPEYILGATHRDGVYVKLAAPRAEYLCLVSVKDNNKRALVSVKEHQTEINVALKAPVHVTGKLLNSVGHPVKNQAITCSIPVDDLVRGSNSVSVCDATTDDQGNFELSVVSADATLTLNVIDEPGRYGDPPLIQVCRFKTAGQNKELGTIRFR